MFDGPDASAETTIDTDYCCDHCYCAVHYFSDTHVYCCNCDSKKLGKWRLCDDCKCKAKSVGDHATVYQDSSMYRCAHVQSDAAISRGSR